MPRYVILYHETPPGSDRPTHWDFMLESGDVLWTWAVESELCVDETVPAQRLADHRIDYLTYEGEISGNRGSVTRWDTGQYEVLEQRPERLVVSLAGERITGVVTLAENASSDEASRAVQRWSVSLRKS